MTTAGIIAAMTELPDQTVETIPAAAAPVAAPVAAPSKSNRLYQAVAWVAIVAGTLFIIAVIFFTGFTLGRHSDGPRHPFGHSKMERQGPHWGPMHDRGPGMRPPGGRDRGPGEPGSEGFGPGVPGPGQPPAAPSTR